MTLPSRSEVLLLGANALPLVGVLVLGWELAAVLLLYWIESAVVGLFNAARMVRVDARGSLALVPFFLVHYGMFMGGHLVFLLLFLSWRGQGDPGLDPALLDVLDVPGWALAVGALVVSHGLSFMWNFLGRREWEGRSLHDQMMAPYGRIVLMHLVILGGAVPVVLFGSPWPLLVLLVVGKSVLDLLAHRKEHGLAPSPTAGEDAGP